MGWVSITTSSVREEWFLDTDTLVNGRTGCYRFRCPYWKRRGVCFQRPVGPHIHRTGRFRRQLPGAKHIPCQHFKRYGISHDIVVASRISQPQIEVILSGHEWRLLELHGNQTLTLDLIESL